MMQKIYKTKNCAFLRPEMEQYYNEIGLQCIDVAENTSTISLDSYGLYHKDLNPIYFNTELGTFDSSGYLV